MTNLVKPDREPDFVWISKDGVKFSYFLEECIRSRNDNNECVRIEEKMEYCINLIN